MKPQEHYWTFRAGDIPELADLPPGTFKGTASDWQSLTPGMRRAIFRDNIKRSTS